MDETSITKSSTVSHNACAAALMTTPDTLLPTAEALVRDYLQGTLIAENHIGAQVRTAWLPDSFGHSPTVPDILSAAGFTSVGFGRADGAALRFTNSDSNSTL